MRLGQRHCHSGHLPGIPDLELQAAERSEGSFPRLRCRPWLGKIRHGPAMCGQPVEHSTAAAGSGTLTR